MNNSWTQNGNAMYQPANGHHHQSPYPPTQGHQGTNQQQPMQQQAYQQQQQQPMRQQAYQQQQQQPMQQQAYQQQQQQQQPVQQPYNHSNHNNYASTQQPQQEYENFQIFRADGKNVFLEVLRVAFEIDKVLINFIQYNKGQQKGNRISSKISIYLNISEFLQIAHDFKFHRFTQMGIKAMEEAKANNRSYAKEIYKKLGGTSARKLANKNESRKDHNSISRQFKITPGAKIAWIFSAEQGAGKESDKGLIVPYGQAEEIIRVPLTYEAVLQMCLKVELEINAYLTAKRLSEWENKK